MSIRLSQYSRKCRIEGNPSVVNISLFRPLSENEARFGPKLDVSKWP